MNNSVKYIVLLVSTVFWLTSHSSTAQEAEVQHRMYSVKDGLPSNEVYDIIQDSKGYIWIATDNGVSRFDGQSFMNLGAEQGLPDQVIFDVHEDHQGRIWFIGLDAVLSYWENDKIHLYRYNNVIQEQLGNDQKLDYKDGFYVRENGEILLSRRNAWAFEVNNQGESEQIVSADSTVCGAYYELKDHMFAVRGSNNRTLMALDSIDVAFYREGGLRDVVRFASTPDKRSHRYATKYLDSYFFCLNGKVYKKELSKHVTEGFGHKTISIYADEYKDLLYVGGHERGVKIFLIEKTEVIELGHFFSSFSISASLADNNGGTWFATLKNGVVYCPAIGVPAYRGKGGLVTDLDVSSDGVLVGYRAGTLDLITDTLCQTILETSEALYDVGVAKVDNRQERVYLGTGNGTMRKYEGGIKRIMKPSPYYWHATLQKGMVSRDGGVLGFSSNIIAGFFDDYVTFNGLKNESFKLTRNESDLLFENLPFSRISDLCLTDSGHLYAVARDSVWRVNEEQTPWLFELTSLGDGVRHMACMGNGNFAFALKQGGVLISKGSEKDTIFEINGAVLNKINDLSVSNGTLWIATSNGAYGITTAGDSLSFNANNGLISSHVTKVLAHDGLVYFGTESGVSIWDGAELRNDAFETPLLIKNIRVNQRDTIVQEHLDLASDQNNVDITFVGLRYLAQGNLLYRYRLGTEHAWQETTENHIRLLQLGKGTYEFEVQVKEFGGHWGTQTAAITLEIRPIFWDTIWFQSLIGLSVLLLIVWYFKIREGHATRERLQTDQKNKLLRDLNESRMQALAQQMNPHFIFNSLNSIQGFIMSNDTENSNKYLTSFAKLMRLNLQNSQTMLIPLEDELEALRHYLELEMARFRDKFTYVFDLDDSMDLSNILVPSLLLQPYIENSILHGFSSRTGTDGLLTVRLEMNEDTEQMICRIQDNGVGRKRAGDIKANKEGTYKSMGTPITEARVRLLNQHYGQEMRIEYKDLVDEKGTEVLICFPLICRY